jgi:hypothetical protein
MPIEAMVSIKVKKLFPAIILPLLHGRFLDQFFTDSKREHKS